MLESCVVRWPPLAPLGTIDVGVMCCLAESSFNVEGTNSDEGDASVEDFFSFLPPSLHMHLLKGCVCVCVCVCVCMCMRSTVDALLLKFDRVDVIVAAASLSLLF